MVGARKPQFDLWGSCVNLARSLQRTSLPNCIHVNELFTSFFVFFLFAFLLLLFSLAVTLTD